MTIREWLQAAAEDLRAKAAELLPCEFGTSGLCNRHSPADHERIAVYEGLADLIDGMLQEHALLPAGPIWPDRCTICRWAPSRSFMWPCPSLRLLASCVSSVLGRPVPEDTANG